MEITWVLCVSVTVAWIHVNVEVPGTGESVALFTCVLFKIWNLHLISKVIIMKILIRLMPPKPQTWTQAAPRAPPSGQTTQLVRSRTIVNTAESFLLCICGVAFHDMVCVQMSHTYRHLSTVEENQIQKMAEWIASNNINPPMSHI